MRRLIEVLGEEEAETLMESLPPVVWHQIATKGDLTDLEERLKAEFVLQNGEFALQLARMTRTMVITFISVSVAMLGVMVAIVHTAPA
ncbi:MAG: hypothetical protein F4Y28_15860 [Acidimicrobiia bacterium]|nr:hypothetical protein [Acidimicrobiia bacterium]MYJ31007.1 hypothetical protein [Acidimicrobiia bacterium]